MKNIITRALNLKPCTKRIDSRRRAKTVGVDKNLFAYLSKP